MNNPYNSIGEILYATHFIVTKGTLFETPSELAKFIKQQGIPNNWKPITLPGRVNDVTTESKKFRTITKEFQEAIIRAVRKRIDQTDNEQIPSLKEDVQYILNSLELAIAERRHNRTAQKRSRQSARSTLER